MQNSIYALAPSSIMKAIGKDTLGWQTNNLHRSGTYLGSRNTRMNTRYKRLLHSQEAIKRLVEDFPNENVVVYDIGIGWANGPTTSVTLAEDIKEKNAEVIGIDNQIPHYIFTHDIYKALFDKNDNLLYFIDNGYGMPPEKAPEWLKEKLIDRARKFKQQAMSRNVDKYSDGNEEIVFNPINEYKTGNLSFVSADMFEIGKVAILRKKPAHIVRIVNSLNLHYQPEATGYALRALLPVVRNNGYVLVGLGDPNFEEEEHLVYKKVGNRFILYGYLWSIRIGHGISYGLGHLDNEPLPGGFINSAKIRMRFEQEVFGEWDLEEEFIYKSPFSQREEDYVNKQRERFDKDMAMIGNDAGMDSVDLYYARKGDIYDLAIRRYEKDCLWWSRQIVKRGAVFFKTQGIQSRPLGTMIMLEVESPNENQGEIKRIIMERIQKYYVDRGGSVLVEEKYVERINVVEMGV